MIAAGEKQELEPASPLERLLAERIAVSGIGVLEHAEFANEPVAAAVAPLATGAVEQLVALDSQRRIQLQRLDRRVEGVRHPHVHTGRPVAARRRALPAALYSNSYWRLNCRMRLVADEREVLELVVRDR